MDTVWLVVFGFDNGIGHDEWPFRSKEGAYAHVATLVHDHGPDGDTHPEFSAMIENHTTDPEGIERIEQARQKFNEIMDDSWVVVYEAKVQD